jgi:hypothetical protein
MSGTSVKPVGMERQQPIRKSPNQIFRKSARQPKRNNKMPKLITAVIAMETNSTKSTVPCVFDSFIVVDLK